MRRPEAAVFRLCSKHWHKTVSQIGIAMMNETVVKNKARFSATVMKMVMGISAQGSAIIEVKYLDFSRHTRKHENLSWFLRF